MDCESTRVFCARHSPERGEKLYHDLLLMHGRGLQHRLLSLETLFRGPNNVIIVPLFSGGFKKFSFYWFSSIFRWVFLWRWWRQRDKKSSLNCRLFGPKHCGRPEQWGCGLWDANWIKLEVLLRSFSVKKGKTLSRGMNDVSSTIEDKTNSNKSAPVQQWQTLHWLTQTSPLPPPSKRFCFIHFSPLPDAGA